MLATSEIALLAGVVAFHLVDTLAMLYSDEVLLVRRRHGWTAVLGSDATLAGRYPALPALLSPGAGVLRLRWNDGRATDAGARDALDTVWAHAAPLKWSSRLMAVWLFVALPACLLMGAAHDVLLILLGVVYATSIGSVAYLVRHRDALGLTRGALASIAFDVIACPPFAINIVRRLTLGRSPGLATVAFVASVLDATSRENVSSHARRRLQLAGLDATCLSPLAVAREAGPERDSAAVSVIDTHAGASVDAGTRAP